MMIEVRNGEGKSPAAIEAELTEAGLYFLVLDVPPVENGAHWHDFSSLFYVTKGYVRLTVVESGEVLDVQPGCRVSVPERALHAENSATGYSILLGVTRDPATFEEDVNLSPADLPG
jgi:hypothetical protein